jgi:predicted PolB exonuclease-like 3'-5' exonuclease
MTVRVTTLDIETSISEPYDEHELVPRLTGVGDEICWEKKPKFPPLPLHIPEVICWLNVQTTNGQKPVFRMEYYDADAEDEKKALERIAKDLLVADRLATWNGRGFDMPLLNLRAMRYGVNWSFWPDRRHRFPNFKTGLHHYDMQDQLGDYGAARSISLDRTSKLMGLPGKVDIDGAEVFEALKRGERRRVIAYCHNDVFENYYVYLGYIRSHFGGGEAMTRLMEAALEWARTNEFLAEFYA